MQTHLLSLINPQWSNAEKTMIDCLITTSQFGAEVLPFTACLDDIEAHGRAIFTDLVAGNYGSIADYVPPPPAAAAAAALPAAGYSSGEIPSAVL